MNPNPVLSASARTVLKKINLSCGTPAYVYFQRPILDRLASYQRSFSRLETLICYALKANSNPVLCRLLARKGAGAEVVSGGELYLALKSGFHPGRIVFSGVGKTSSELAQGLRGGIGAFNVESLEELQALDRAASRLRKKAPVAIRLNPGVHADTHSHIATGRPTDKFGVSEPSARQMAELVSRSRSLELTGLHCHIGSQINSLWPFQLALKKVLRLYSSLRGRHPSLSYLDMGGGLGLRLSPGQLASVFVPPLKSLGLRLLLEPGRSLVAQEGILLTKVIYRKEVLNRRLLIVDAGMNDLIRPALYGAHHPILAVNPRKGPSGVWDVVGPICESGDVLARGAELADPRPGELLAVMEAGAYGFSMSSNYNSRPRPAEVLVDGGRFRLCRPRETYRRMFA